MEVSGTGKSPNTSLSFRYNANNEELEELFQPCEDDPPTPQCEPPPVKNESASPKRPDKTSSILDKYFKSMRTEKPTEKPVEKAEDVKPETKVEETKIPPQKEVTSSPMKEYLNRLGKRSTSEGTPEPKEPKEPNETWKIFSDFKFKIAQAVEDMKTRSVEETREKSIPRENSTSDSEESSAMKDDQQSVGDTDNQVSSLDSSIQNLSEMTQPLTAKATERETSLPAYQKNNSESSNDTHKNLDHSDSLEAAKDSLNDNMMEVESGVEAMEDTIDAFGDMTPINTDSPSRKPIDPTLPQPIPNPLPANFGLPPSKNNHHSSVKPNKEKSYFLNFFMYFLTFFLVVNYLLFPNCNVWNGFLLGIWFFCLASNLKQWLLDNYFSEWEPKKGFFQLKKSSTMPLTYTIPSVKEHRPMKKYEGWINHYRFPDYDPNTYHINKTTTAFMKLEGCNLRISYTRTKIAKRALWDEKIDKVVFYQHRLYNLSGARIILLPKGLVRRRQWSKKYPICVILSDKEKIQVLEKENLAAAEKKTSESLEKKGKEQQPEVESTETNTSPEKKRKFIWRKREKSISHSDGETGREGLRHRIVRKMHRGSLTESNVNTTDKKADSVSTGTEPEGQGQADKNTQPDDSPVHEPELELGKSIITKDDDEEFDDSELSRIKEFLEEAELDTAAEGTVEGEWSVHVKQSKDKHSHLYLFARTGRDKHEWFRRLSTAISEASPPSNDSSAAEDKSASDAQETKDGIEMAVYKASEKDIVAFAKTKTSDSVSEGVTITTAPRPVSPTIHSNPSFDTYEKVFWPYLLKIIQAHETVLKQTADVGVTCQLEPSPPDKTKSKKRKKGDTQSSSPECNCRSLPAEVAWVNTLLARIMFDVMRDPHIVARVQNRIQRKLNTLKLPSFMSPLVIRDLSLSGACPAAARVAASWDERGVWLDLDLRYDGGASIDILTQINLMKLKEKNITLEDHLLAAAESTIEEETHIEPGIVSDKLLRKSKPAIFDSDVEDSAESSSDDESPPMQPVDSAENITISDSVSVTNEGSSSKKKFLRMVDKIATNKYFQQVTDYKYIKRAMEGLSNTDIKLQLEVQGLEGRLAVNLPPPPHDRVWIGFRTNPQLVLKARPAVGARTLRFTHISNWIEQKLTREFEKVLVLPNMEDISVDIMTPTPVSFE